MPIIIAALLALVVASCATDELPINQDGPEFKDPADLDLVPDRNEKGDVVPATFNANFIIDDAFFTHDTIVTAAQLQELFEKSPYNNRSWLADAEFDGVSASEAIVAASLEYKINPVMLLVRLQVEQGLVSKTVRPSQRKINRALGCGCQDGSACSSRFLGFKNQMFCGAETHRRLLDQSIAGNGAWRKDKTRSTLDPTRVTPENHATAALYGYTPWVLRGTGGNWLVWNIIRKFSRHMIDEGIIEYEEPAWIGTPCKVHADCGFSASDQDGFCYDFLDVYGDSQGFCTIVCDGYCPDKRDAAPTFCIAAQTPGVGVCASQSDASNDQCSKMPGTRIEARDRFIGTSGASAREATVCAPDTP